MTNVLENLGNGAVFNDNGDVLPASDFSDEGLPMVNSSRIAHMRNPIDEVTEDIDEYYLTIDQVHATALALGEIRETTDSTERNKYLAGMTLAVGKYKQHRGAESRLTANMDTPGYGGSVENAEKASARSKETAMMLGEKACGSCSLKDYCHLNPTILFEKLVVTSNRARFKPRVEKTSNSHLCENLLTPGRLKN